MNVKENFNMELLIGFVSKEMNSYEFLDYFTNIQSRPPKSNLIGIFGAFFLKAPEMLTFSIITIRWRNDSLLKNFWNWNRRENLISSSRVQSKTRKQKFSISPASQAKGKLFHSLKQQNFLLHDSSSPVTSSSTDNLIFGSVLTWHSYLRKGKQNDKES